MNWPFVLRSRHDADVAALNADRDRLRRRAETAEGHAATAVSNRKQVLRQNAELDAANARLSGRVDELTRQLEAKPSFEDSASLKNQIRHLQRRLDDAVGLGPGRRPEDSSRWQPGYQQPKPTKESAS